MHLKIAAIHTGPNTHLDHLGVLAQRLNIPLYVTDEKVFELAQKFYPTLRCYYKGLGEMTLEFMASQFDVILQCGKFWAAELLPLFELFYHKKMRFAFCPHGNSDKGVSLTPDHPHTPQDIAFVYGEQMVDLLTKTGALDKVGTIIRTGNYRLPFYERRRNHFDTLAHKQVFSKFDPSKKTIFYAPTWASEENATSFTTHCHQIIEQLKGSYNILIKLHPFLEEDHPALVHEVTAKYERHRGVIFLRDFPPIYPLLNKSDIYLGDFSSIGYDFLAFDRPLYFLNPKGQSAYLHQCGVEIPLEQQKNLATFISSTLTQNTRDLSAVRLKAYSYAFGTKRTAKQIREELLFNCRVEAAQSHQKACQSC